MTLAITAYFIVATVLWTAGDRAHRAAGVIASVPFVAHLAVAGFAAADPDRIPAESFDWIPALGVTIDIRIDALTLLLSGMVAFIGLLITIYSYRYVAAPSRRVNFLALLVLFTGGMAGIVASDNLYALFLFWEVTTVASYLLIGYDDESASARAAALQAVLVTTAGGLAMLAGFVLLHVVSGTSSIAALPEALPDGSAATVAMVLVLLGAFTKSAQAPFHFWLPGAMSAPTPASAYLHSATMVKAGIVLLVLMEPVFAAQPLWGPIVVSVGLVTMALGAVVAIRQHDLKLLLAHGTISQLGFMVALIGLGYVAAAVAVLLAHAAFKAALFLVVGAVDKSTGTRDIRALGGLRRHLPGLSVASALAAASMAGLPPLVGFVTKEAAFDLLVGDRRWVPLIVIGLASALTVAYSARFWFGAFGGRAPEDADQPKRVSASIWGPPVILSTISLIAGLVTLPLADSVAAATGALIELPVWPGLKTALAISAAVWVFGFAAFAWSRRTATADARSIRTPSASGAYAAAVRGLNRVADIVTGLLQNGSLPVYLAVILTTVLLVPTTIWLTSWPGGIDLPVAHSPAEVVLGLGIVVAAFAAARVDRRLAAALLLGVVGYSVAGLYVAFRAPDLALTQVLAETLTVALFAFVLAKLPRRFGSDPASLSRGVRLLVSGLVGVTVTIAALLTTVVEPDRAIATVYADRAVDAGGRNVVNIILTNFRALDTLGEITVLAIAAAGVSALVLAARRSHPSEERA